MAETNDKKDQEPRSDRKKIIELVEKQERLRIAECYAKGGTYTNGSCHR